MFERSTIKELWEVVDWNTLTELHETELDSATTLDDSDEDGHLVRTEMEDSKGDIVNRIGVAYRNYRSFIQNFGYEYYVSFKIHFFYKYCRNEPIKATPKLTKPYFYLKHDSQTTLIISLMTQSKSFKQECPYLFPSMAC